jgi:hypothetical protein
MVPILGKQKFQDRIETEGKGSKNNDNNNLVKNNNKNSYQRMTI